MKFTGTQSHVVIRTNCDSNPARELSMHVNQKDQLAYLHDHFCMYMHAQWDLVLLHVEQFFKFWSKIMTVVYHAF